MKRKAAFLLLLLVAVAIATLMLMKAPGADPGRPISVSFVGFTNALPFAEAPEETRGLHALFQVTNHAARSTAYRTAVEGFRVEGKVSTGAVASFTLLANSSGTFMVPTHDGSNDWTFLVVTSSWRPRPAWQHQVNEFAKLLGGSPVFRGRGPTYSDVTNTWTTPRS